MELEDYIRVSVELVFEAGKVACDFCPLLETYARKQCRRTGEYIVDSRARGRWCPFKLTDEQRDAVTKANFK